MFASNSSSARPTILNRWFTFYPTHSNISDEIPKLRIFCFPFSGGSAQTFFDWTKLISGNGIEMVGITLPGRLHRLQEKDLYKEIEPLVKDLVSALEPFTQLPNYYLEQQKMNSSSSQQQPYRNFFGKFVVPFVFFGHSLGATVAFETAREMRRRGFQQLPLHLFCAGQMPPHKRVQEKKYGSMSRSEFVNVLKDYKATPKEILENEEFLDMILPPTQSDFGMHDNYIHVVEPPLDINLNYLGGLQDNCDNQEFWCELTSKKFKSKMYAGDHFFILKNQQLNEVLDDMLVEMKEIIEQLYSKQ